jgi:hypothetical protein
MDMDELEARGLALRRGWCGADIASRRIHYPPAARMRFVHRNHRRVRALADHRRVRAAAGDIGRYAMRDNLPADSPASTAPRRPMTSRSART